ncbi:MAG: phage major capsid protein [Nitrospirae bacterium]|nr:phage major capsid protein [Nitrospirota bacterium]
MSIERIKWLREERARLAKQAREILDRAGAEKRELTGEENAKWEAIMADIDRHGEEVRRLEKQGGIEGELSRSQGVMAGRQDTGPAIGEEAREGRLLTREQKVTDIFRGRVDAAAEDEYRGLTLGGFLRSMVVGPKTPAERRALSAGTDSAGGYTVPTLLSAELIDRLRTKAHVTRAGSRTLLLDPGKSTTLAKITADPTATWTAENGTVTASDPTFGALTFTPQTLIALVKVSRQLVEDSLNIEEALTAAFSGSMAAELDRVALFGTGTAPEPRGLKNVSGVGSVSMGTNGAALTNFDPFITSAQTILDANGPLPAAAIMAPRTFASIGKLKDTTNQPMTRPGILSGLNFFESTVCPVNETQGTSSNASRVFLGDFLELVIGMRADVRIEVLRERFSDNFQYGFLCHLRADVQVMHPESFCQVIGIIP